MFSLKNFLSLRFWFEFKITRKSASTAHMIENLFSGLFWRRRTKFWIPPKHALNGKTFELFCVCVHKNNPSTSFCLESIFFWEISQSNCESWRGRESHFTACPVFPSSHVPPCSRVMTLNGPAPVLHPGLLGFVFKLFIRSRPMGKTQNSTGPLFLKEIDYWLRTTTDLFEPGERERWTEQESERLRAQ